MSNETLSILLETQTFLSINLKQKLNSFVLNYNKTNYLISVHHFLPVKCIYNSINNDELTIKINSCWSEILVIDTTNINLNNLNINYKIQNKLPKYSEKIYMKANNINYNMIIIDYALIPFNNLSNDFTIPYIRCRFDNNIDILSGLSGSPIFMDNKLIGVFSKFDSKESLAYIIPIYIVIKNLIKEDNYNIYSLPILDSKILKINSYNIKDNYIYHPSLKIKIPLNTFLMMEGDMKTKLLIKYDITINMITKPIKINISNENFIINKENEYKINSRLLNLLKNLNINKQIIINLINQINKSTDSNDLWFTFRSKD